MGEITTIDGSMGEGGGQILRTSLALAAALGKPIKIVNIRAKRKNPGLQRQHIVSVKAVASLSNAEVEGLYLGSTKLVFRPRRLRGGSFYFDIGTAGSVSLVFQAVMPLLFLIKEEVTITLRGGTDVPWSPPIDYVRFVLLELLKKLGLQIEIILKQRGHYPRGGGLVIIKSRGKGYIEPLNLTSRGDVEYIEGLSHCVRLPKHVAERQALAAKEHLKKKYPQTPISISLEYYEPSKDPHLGPGSGIVLWAKARHSVLGSDALGKRGKRAEDVGREAALKLIEDLESSAAVDRHASDMLIPVLALARGTSSFTGAFLTMHAYTNIQVVKLLMPSVDISFFMGGELNRPFGVRIRSQEM